MSLHSALAFYGLIPETVLQITSVTSLKTAVFKNDFGEYSYQSWTCSTCIRLPELKAAVEKSFSRYDTPSRGWRWTQWCRSSG